MKLIYEWNVDSKFCNWQPQIADEKLFSHGQINEVRK